MLIATTLFTTAVAAQVLREFIARIADVHEEPLHGVAARLDTTGERPVVWLNSTSSPQSRMRALMDVMRVLALDLPPEHGRPVRRLRPVS